MKRRTVTLKKINAGYSLVELLVVIAILSIVVGMASIGISLASSRNAEKSAKVINDALEFARMNAMSKKGEFTLEIDFSGHFLTVNSSESGEVKREQLPQNVTVTVKEDTSQNNVSVQFDKSTGKVISIKYSDGAEKANDISVLHITSDNNNGKEASVVLVTNTGKHYVDYQ